MSSQIKLTHSHQDRPISPYTGHLSFDFQSLRPFQSLSQLHPSPLHVITTRAWEGGPKEHRAKQKWPRETHSVTYVPGLSTLCSLLLIAAQPPPSLLCCPMPPSHHPSNPTQVSHLPVPHRKLRPSTSFWRYGTQFETIETILFPQDMIQDIYVTLEYNT